MDETNELARVDAQERALRLRTFDLSTAWEVGSRLRDAALQRGGAITIEIRLQRETVFFCAMPGTTPENTDWARRKRNTVELMHRSSYAVGLALARDAMTLEQKMGLPSRDYAVHGGGVPVWVEGVAASGPSRCRGCRNETTTNSWPRSLLAFAEWTGAAFAPAEAGRELRARESQVLIASRTCRARQGANGCFLSASSIARAQTRR